MAGQQQFFIIYLEVSSIEWDGRTSLQLVEENRPYSFNKLAMKMQMKLEAAPRVDGDA